MPIYRTGKSKDSKQQYRVIVNHTDSFGAYKKISKSVYGLAEAKLAELELQQNIEEGEISSNIKVGQLWEEYRSAVIHELRASTMRKKEATFNNHILPKLKNHRLTKLTAPILQRWKNDIAKKNLSLRMKQNIYKEFSAMLNFAVRTDRIKSNPLSKIGNFKDAYTFDRPQDKIHYYTSEQFKQFITAAATHNKSLNDYGFFTFFNIAFYTGMRKGEINALRWCDIKGNIIHITRSVNQKLKGKQYEFTPPKNVSSVRNLQIPECLMVILEQQKQLQQQNTPCWSEDFLVCGGINCLSDTSISNKNILYAKEAGLEPIRIHDFRHTHATLLVNSGINIMEISRRLGHADANITWKIYAHLYPKEEEKAITILDNIS